jgi:hypothetical protein
VPVGWRIEQPIQREAAVDSVRQAAMATAFLARHRAPPVLLLPK